MNGFTGTATPLTTQGLQSCLDTLSVKSAELWAVLQVETRGCGFFTDRRPAILFERHIFSGKTGGRFDKQAPDISNPKAGGYAGGMAEYTRLEKALKLDEDAALASASWGLGQVMGFHASDLGYGTVQQFVTRMMASEDEQLGALVAFIQRNGLDKPLRAHDWATFARGYNGPGYAKNEYDKKLAAAYQKLSTHSQPDLAVREGQMRLLFLGFDPGGVDGAFGPKTKAAMNSFQGQHQLPTTAQFDAATLAALRKEQDALPRSEGTRAAPALPAVTPSAQPASLVAAPPPEATPPVVSLATRPAPSAPASAEPPSRLLPLPVSSVTPAPTAPAPVEAVVVRQDVPLPAQLSEQLQQRLTRPLGKDAQDELARLLVLRTQAARELDPSAVETVDLGLTALLAEEPNVSFARDIRQRIGSAVADQLYPLRPLAVMRSSSPATQVVLGLGLLLLTVHGLSAVAHELLTTEKTTLFGLPARTMLLMGLCGSLGSAVSILMRLKDLEKVQGASRLSMLMLGFFKPVVGLYCALFCFALMKAGLLPLQASTPEAELYLHTAVCFLVGFSERLAQDMFARAEEGLSAATGKAKS